MSVRVEITQVVRLLEGDEDLLVLLRRHGVVTGDDELTAEEVELCCVARTLVRELDVNLEGVEIILRMRRDLLETRRQLSALADELRRQRDSD